MGSPLSLPPISQISCEPSWLIFSRLPVRLRSFLEFLYCYLVFGSEYPISWHIPLQYYQDFFIKRHVFPNFLLECAHGICVPLNCSGKERKNQWTLDLKCNSLLTQGSQTLACWKNSPLKAVCNSHSSFPRIWTERKRKYIAYVFTYNIFPFWTPTVTAGKQNAVSTVKISSFSLWMIKVWWLSTGFKKKNHCLAQRHGCLLAKLYGRNPEEKASFHKSWTFWWDDCHHLDWVYHQFSPQFMQTPEQRDAFLRELSPHACSTEHESRRPRSPNQKCLLAESSWSEWFSLMWLFLFQSTDLWLTQKGICFTLWTEVSPCAQIQLQQSQTLQDRVKWLFLQKHVL